MEFLVLYSSRVHDHTLAGLKVLNCPPKPVLVAVLCTPPALLPSHHQCSLPSTHSPMAPGSLALTPSVLSPQLTHPCMAPDSLALTPSVLSPTHGPWLSCPHATSALPSTHPPMHGPSCPHAISALPSTHPPMHGPWFSCPHAPVLSPQLTHPCMAPCSLALTPPALPSTHPPMHGPWLSCPHTISDLSPLNSPTHPWPLALLPSHHQCSPLNSPTHAWPLASSLALTPPVQSSQPPTLQMSVILGQNE